MEELSTIENIEAKVKEVNFDNFSSFEQLLYSEAGIVALILLFGLIWLAGQYWLERRAHKRERDAHAVTVDKLYNLGNASVAQSTQTNSTLEKVYQLLLINLQVADKQPTQPDKDIS